MTSKKSTTDRAVPIGLKALRMWFAVESRLSPLTAERRAARLFATPPRQRRSGAGSIARSLERDSGQQRFDLLVRDGTVDVWTTTVGSGPMALMVHGWGGSANDMMPLATQFADAGFRSVIIDMPGHGRSPGRESSLVEFLRAIRAVTSSLGAPELIVGHSFGGAAAVFGITELRLPVRAAVLIAPAPGPAYYVDRFARTLGLPTARTDGMVRNLVERVGRSIESLDAIVAARSADVPALILHDKTDREVPFSFSEQMSRAWKSSRLVATSSGGHRRILRDQVVIDAAVDFGTAAIAAEQTSRT